MSAKPAAWEDDRRASELREREDLLERAAETYLALADRLDDEIAAFEVAQRLTSPVPDVDFDALLEEAEQDQAGG